MELDFIQILMSAGFIGARITGLLLVAPMLGSIAIAARIKAGLLVSLTALLYSAHSPHAEMTSPIAWLQGAFREVFVGFVLGLTVQFVFESAQFAGQVLGVQMGFSLVNVLDPQSQVDTPVLSIFHQLAVLLIFLQLNVHHWLIRGLARSFDYVPVSSWNFSRFALETLVHGSSGIFMSAIQISAPALVATVLADAALGFFAKASPQLPVLFLGLSIKSVLGMLVLITGFAAWPAFFEPRFADAVASGERALSLVH